MVVQPKRIVRIQRIILLCVEIIVMGLGLYWERDLEGGLLAVFVSIGGLLLAAYGTGFYRGGHQKLWTTERQPVQDAQATA